MILTFIFFNKRYIQYFIKLFDIIIIDQNYIQRCTYYKRINHRLPYQKETAILISKPKLSRTPNVLFIKMKMILKKTSKDIGFCPR